MLIKDDYLNYHLKSMEILDVDPQNPALKYICKRFDLNIEQRYWIAFLFGTCYCAPTVYYIYNEFPDFENVNIDRLQRWWDSNKSKCKFQSDRLRIKTTNKFVESFYSYRKMLEGKTQEQFFLGLANSTNKQKNYQDTWDKCLKDMKHFGRFSLFIYLELLYELCDLHISPTELDVANAKSSRNGLLCALGKSELVDCELSNKQLQALELLFQKNVKYINSKEQGSLSTAWSVETSLCAYKKHVLRKQRWVGYYVDRQADEIAQMEKAVSSGVDWSVLWDFRRECYRPSILCEYKGKRSTYLEPYL